jgi:hypothetical protein
MATSRCWSRPRSLIRKPEFHGARSADRKLVGPGPEDTRNTRVHVSHFGRNFANCRRLAIHLESLIFSSLPMDTPRLVAYEPTA